MGMAGRVKDMRGILRKPVGDMSREKLVEGGRGAGADAALSDRSHGGRAGGPRSPSFTKSAGQCDAAAAAAAVVIGV